MLTNLLPKFKISWGSFLKTLDLALCLMGVQGEAPHRAYKKLAQISNIFLYVY
jgi:hypothetical protein